MAFKRMILLLLGGTLTSAGWAQGPVISGRDARQIEFWNDADQAAWLKRALDQGVPLNMGDDLAVLVMSHGSLAVPIIERKIEEVLASKSPASCFSDSSVDPQRFIIVAAGEITRARDQNGLRAISNLMKIDENRFGSYVAFAFGYAFGSPKNALVLAYEGFDIGDPALDRRIVAWMEPLFASKQELDVLRMKRWWAEAIVERYGGPPTEVQWTTDPIASRLKRPIAESLHNDVVQLAAEALRKRSAK